MNRTEQRREVDENYDAFQRAVADLLPDHRDQYALMKDRRVIEFYDTARAALHGGATRYPDQVFSIQEVTDEPIDLGFFSHAGA